MENRNINLIPFREFFISNDKIDFGEIILNVMIFLPLGIYTGVLFKKWNFRKKLFLFFLISLSVEALQLILKVGSFDITDIINNTFGGIIGLLIFVAIEKLFNNINKTLKIINIIASIATILMISLLILLKMQMLPIRYQ